MMLEEWAKKWNIPDVALEELRLRMGLINDGLPAHQTGNSESTNSDNVRLEASKKGHRLWRNNVGMAQGPGGQPIRYGLCNTSSKVNRELKSSDLIGIKKVLIMPDMVGSYIGQFTAREIKASGWRYAGTERERAQLNFINLVLSLGGDAAFATGPGTL